MSEKRFVVETVAVRDEVITDTEKCYSYEDLDEIVDKLNEQQATIKQLESDKAIAEDYANIFEKENVKLRKQIDEQQATITELERKVKKYAKIGEEQLKQIMELQEENEQLKKQLNKKNTINMQLREINKELGDDLHNCRLNKNIISEKLKLWQDAHKEYDIYNIKDFEELMKNDK